MNTDPGPAPGPAWQQPATCGRCARDLPRRARTVGVVSWCSFLVAAAATTVTFAFVDPQSFHHVDGPAWTRDRLTMYALGFFAYWIVAASSAALTIYMAHTDRPPFETP